MSLVKFILKDKPHSFKDFDLMLQEEGLTDEEIKTVQFIVNNRDEYEIIFNQRQNNTELSH